MLAHEEGRLVDLVRTLVVENRQHGLSYRAEPPADGVRERQVNCLVALYRAVVENGDTYGLRVLAYAEEDRPRSRGVVAPGVRRAVARREVDRSGALVAPRANDLHL